jgi:glycosyltransferase involved in cell wall biosynthesis
MTQGPVRVLLITEGTYPYHFGGVSTWCHSLLQNTPDVDFTLMSIVGDAKAEPKYVLPKSVKRFLPIPLWGIHDAMEMQRDLSLRNIIKRKRQCTEATIASEFIPLFRSFIGALFADGGNAEHLTRVIHGMYCFFQDYDFSATLRSFAVWNCFVQVANEAFPEMAARYDYPGAKFSLMDLTTSMGWVYHWLFVLAYELPRVDVVHTAMVGVSTLVALAVKQESGAAYLLTEHGVYLRECYLAEVSSSGSLFQKLLKLHFARLMTMLSYSMADQISPCCDYNKRWELRNGAPSGRLKTIYYGVDSKVFKPLEKPAQDPPVVVWVGRINPLKDLETLLRSAALVHQTRPDIQFRLFGSASREDEKYYEQIKALHAELKLDGVVNFCGYTAQPQNAYNQGDLVILCSISEAFPFSILEAMLCGKPIVATAVGGVPEEIDGCGIAVDPRNPSAMADAILALMNNPAECAALGRVAREKAVQGFGIAQSCQIHLSAYQHLSRRNHNAAPVLISPDSIQLNPDRVKPLDVQVAHGTCDYDPSLETPSLVDEVRRRVPLPIDRFEITALLESMGITDSIALKHYQASDVFCLAEAVLVHVRRSKCR